MPSRYNASSSDNAIVIVDIEKPFLCEEDKELLLHPAVGGLILFTRNFADTQQLLELVREIRALRSALLICVDHEGGRVQRFKDGFTLIPAMQNIANYYVGDSTASLVCAEGLAASAHLGWLMASEVLAFDIDISFAPVLDLDKSYSTIIGDRAFSDSPQLATQLASAFIAGMADAGMRATGKHFPGHGGVREDSHIDLPVDRRARSELDERDLIPFVKLMPQLHGIMPAHIVFPQVDDQPVGFSRIWLQGILRDELGFDGIIFSDDLSMEGAAIFPQYADRANAAIEAGCDSILVCNHRRGAIEVVESVEKIRENLDCNSLTAMKTTQARATLRSVQASERYGLALDVVSRLS